jgi:tetratricopeptide (TPR) repeat protein
MKKRSILIRLNKAYNFMNRGDELIAENKAEEAMKSYAKAMEMYPDNAEMVFWPAVTLASTGKVDESLPLFKKVFAMDYNWVILAKRLPRVGQLRKDRALLKKILAQAPPER